MVSTDKNDIEKSLAVRVMVSVQCVEILQLIEHFLLACFSDLSCEKHLVHHSIHLGGGGLKLVITSIVQYLPCKS